MQYHLKQKDNWLAKELMEKMYMDNIVTGTDRNDKALKYPLSLQRYLQEAGMNL